ncbi:histidine kinase/DNA gyrase B/HSP90-like ATPase [Dinghuibacter silviterrae]|uniref:histidine kinase n=2 Tax=Dinghuibacter silviterrae TaxID=1539049 RepID=A0A4R8DG05_9BACT|nr:histidine kinase/DNA gyrase B/HSP90-like ATPase [Dinghuibacter silviterrae]
MPMIRALFNWRTLLSVIAIGIVTGSIIYSDYLSRKLAEAEKQKVEQWVEANRVLAATNEREALNLASSISSHNIDIPLIATDEQDSIVDWRNLDSTRVLQDKGFLKKELKLFKTQHDPIIWEQSKKPYIYNKVYYGESLLQKEIRYYPIVQLTIIALFLIVIITAMNTRYKSTQNQVWAGMAKETAHQLGTPVSSLEAWVELLKEGHDNASILPDLERDVARLRLVSDRFSKIGSAPKLEQRDLLAQVQQMIEYMRKRASGKVQFHLNVHGAQPVLIDLSGPLFDWVMENLMKNALDAMEGKGLIVIDVHNHPTYVTVDVTDSGKGIQGKNLQKVFKPGFTTKKRGWGLGLSLSRRIIEQYHHGTLNVKWSEPGKGTAFRIVLKR